MASYCVWCSDPLQLLSANQIPENAALTMLSRSHPFFPTFEALMREAAAHPPVYDLGTSQRFAREVGLVRDLFAPEEYFAGGFNPDRSIGPDACDFHCDVQNLAEIADGSAGCVLSMEVLEHVQEPRRAVAEMYRILRPGGLVIAAVPFLFTYHGKSGRTTNPVWSREQPTQWDHAHGGYADYWRFSHEGLAQLFGEAGFSRVDAYPIDGRLLSRLALFGLIPPLSRVPGLLRFLGHFDCPRLGRATTMHFVHAQKAT